MGATIAAEVPETEVFFADHLKPHEGQILRLNEY